MLDERMKVQENQLMRDGKFLFDLLSQSCDDYLFMHDKKQDIFKISEKFLEEFDLPASCLRSSDEKWLQMIYPDDRPAFLKALAELDAGFTDVHDLEYRLKNRHDEYVWIRSCGRAVRDADGEIPLFAGVVSVLGRQNRIDALTGMRNKYQFEYDIEEFLEQKVEPYGIIMILGLDNFRNINETYNRLFGDSVLRRMGRKLEEILPGSVRCYRLDGDEFGVFYTYGSKKDAEEIFFNIKRYANVQHQIGKGSYFCTVSAGCVSFPEDGKTYLALYKHAEAALELAKQHGKNTLFHFRKQAYEQLIETLEMKGDLRRSVKNNCCGFEIYFQAQVDAGDGRVNGAEALLRWHSPLTGKIVSPEVFIPILEESKLILEVGRWVLVEAMKICKEWQRVAPDFTISVNVSYTQFKERDFKFFVVEQKEKFGLPPNTLILELTESCIAADFQFLNQEFEFLRSHGICTAMDDFGSGYSSLNLLKDLSTNIVKIDKVFVKQMLKSSFDRMLVESTINLCHSIGLKVCIEGAEAPEEYRVLQEMHADSVQGFLFSRPEPRDIFYEHFLKPLESTQS